MKKHLFFLSLFLCFSFTASAELKYIFYLIGDGMGANQVLAAEMYQAELDGKIGRNRLTMTSFPYSGQAATFSFTNGITDSSAAGTALSTGHKTRNGMLGLTPDSMRIASIAELLRDQGYSIGIMTTVAIDHATPGAFYAHVDNRNSYYTIGKQLVESRFDFFGGAGFHKPENKAEWNAPNLYDLCEENGYTLAHGYKDAQTKLDSDKLIMVQENDGIDRTKKSDALTYVIDRKEGDLSLPQIVETAIKFLSRKDKFFMMIEGGMIDYSGHSRDGATNIKETIEFDEAVALAYQFYLQHPDETLIVVTADHETGGMALGNSDYTLNLQMLQYQKASSWIINGKLSDMYKQYEKKLKWEQVKDLLQNTLGFYDTVELNETEEQMLFNAYKKLIRGKSTAYKTLYNNISDLGGKAVSILNYKAKMGWTSYAHTASAVPIFAIGQGAERFTGWHDNTEIPAIIMFLSTETN